MCFKVCYKLLWAALGSPFGKERWDIHKIIFLFSQSINHLLLHCAFQSDSHFNNNCCSITRPMPWVRRTHPNAPKVPLTWKEAFSTVNLLMLMLSLLPLRLFQVFKSNSRPMLLLFQKGIPVHNNTSKEKRYCLQATYLLWQVVYISLWTYEILAQPIGLSGLIWSTLAWTSSPCAHTITTGDSSSSKSQGLFYLERPKTWNCGLTHPKHTLCPSWLEDLCCQSHWEIECTASLYTLQLKNKHPYFS